MASKIADKLASLRAMIPEHRVMVLEHYDESAILELLNEAVRDHTVEQQRVILLNRPSEEDGGKVEGAGEVKAVIEVVEAVHHEDFDQNMVDIDDGGDGYDSEERGKYPRGHFTMEGS
jgi:hypothetical protein